MPPGVNHRHCHVEAGGRLDRRRYQYRRTAWEAVNSDNHSDRTTTILVGP